MKELRWDSQGRSRVVNVVQVGLDFVQPRPTDDKADKGYSLETLTAVLLSLKPARVQ